MRRNPQENLNKPYDARTAPEPLREGDCACIDPEGCQGACKRHTALLTDQERREISQVSQDVTRAIIWRNEKKYGAEIPRGSLYAMWSQSVALANIRAIAGHGGGVTARMRR